MQLSDKTIKILKNLTYINPSIKFVPGNEISVISPGQRLKATATIEETFTKEFFIFDVPKLLGVLSLFENPEIVTEDDYLYIEDKTRSVTYTYTALNCMREDAYRQLPQLETVERFTLTSGAYADTIKALSVLGLPELKIVGDGSNLYLKGINTVNPSSDTYVFKLGKTDSEFESVFSIENFKFIKDVDYEVEINPRYATFNSSDVIYYVVREA